MLQPADKDSIIRLENRYRGRVPFYGDMHDHSNSGGTSDGSCTLAEWKAMLDEKKMDFVAILDHRQVRHMYLPEWDNRRFVCGTEPGTCITDARANPNELHYNILVSDPGVLRDVLTSVPVFQYAGGIEDHFRYPFFTREAFGRLIDTVKEKGGFFVIPHPKQVMRTDDDEEFWFRDGVGLEVIYVGYETQYSRDDYALWVRLLSRGKRIFACAGGDLHNRATDRALTTVYAEKEDISISHAFLPYLRAGDFTAGGAGIRMTLGDALCGGHTAFGNGDVLTVCVGDFHESLTNHADEFRLDVYAGDTVVGSGDLSGRETVYFSLRADPGAPFYRAEVVDVRHGYRVCVGNPIWNDSI